MIKDIISKKLKDVKLNKWKRILYKVILGEFDRINDGKPISNDECISVIKKMVKNSREILKYEPQNQVALREIKELEQFLPNAADEDMMEKVINQVLTDNTFKNIMQAMKPCIDELKSLGFDVDKGKLSKLLKEKKLYQFY